MMIYFAAPIDQVTAGDKDDQNRLLRLAWSGVSALSDCVVFHPAGAWRVHRKTMPDEQMQTINLDILSRCDVLIAVLPAGTPTVGVILEISHAISHQIPVVLVTDLLEVSWSLRWVVAQELVAVCLTDNEHNLAKSMHRHIESIRKDLER